MRRWLGAVATIWQRFLQDDRGAEVVQFALAIPILLSVVWAGIEFWQIMTLRTAVRSTAAQIARYIAAYGARPREDDPEPYTSVPPEDVCANLEGLVNAALRNRRGNMGAALSWQVTLYNIQWPDDPSWEGNAVPAGGPCADFLAALECNQQFGIQLDVSVPWQTVIFGLSEVQSQQSTLRMSERAVGAGPCKPYCEITQATAQLVSGGSGPGGCEVDVCWELDCSFVPEYVQVVIDGVSDPQYRLYGDRLKRERCITVRIPPGQDSMIALEIKAQRRRDHQDIGLVGCGAPPTPTP